MIFSASIRLCFSLLLVNMAWVSVRHGSFVVTVRIAVTVVIVAVVAIVIVIVVISSIGRVGRRVSARTLLNIGSETMAIGQSIPSRLNARSPIDSVFVRLARCLQGSHPTRRAQHRRRKIEPRLVVHTQPRSGLVECHDYMTLSGGHVRPSPGQGPATKLE